MRRGKKKEQYAVRRVSLAGGGSEVLLAARGRLARPQMKPAYRQQGDHRRGQGHKA